ncbi:SH3 domain-containing protein [Glutamicibacter sp. AOP5-A2-7]
MRKQPRLGQRFMAIVGFLALAAPLSLAPPAHGVAPADSVPVQVAGQESAQAAPVTDRKKAGAASTTVNLKLRERPETSSASLGTMAKGTVVSLTGKVQGNWSQLSWGSKTGWSATRYLNTGGEAKQEPQSLLRGNPASTQYRYVQQSGATYSHWDPKKSTVLGRIHLGERYEVRRWAASSRRDEILVDGQWVWTAVTDRQRVDLQYRYAQSTGPVYTASGKATGTIRRGTKVQYGAWNSKTRRDEIKLNGRWAWAGVTNRTAPRTEYRYAQKNGNLYDRADQTQDKKIGTIGRGTRVQWATWNAANRRDEVKVNGKWVWTDVTNRHKPAGTLPPVSNVSDYARFTTKSLSLLKDPSYKAASVGHANKGMKVIVTHKAEGGWVKIKVGSLSGFIKEKDNLRLHGPYPVAVYGTLRTGQSAYNVMGGFQQKAMNQRFSRSSLYQLWNRNWTFLTNGPKTVVAEQFQYSDARGPGMLRKLDIYEIQLRYQGRPMYTRQNVRLTDGSQSWTYKTTAFSEKVVKNSGRYISSGDFLKRS